MKRIFKSLLIAFISLFASISTVLAAGSVNVTLSPNSTTVTKGNNVTVTIKVSNITGAANDQIAGAGGYINFDSEYLQYVYFAVLSINPKMVPIASLLSDLAIVSI